MITASPEKRWLDSGERSASAAILIGVLLLLLGLSSGRAEATRLRIESEEPGRPIWVNGVFVGTGDALVDSVGAEPTVVEVGEPLYSSTWIQPWQISLAELDVEERRIRVPALQRLTLQSPLSTLRVWVDEREVGRTPISLLVPSSVPVRVRAEAEKGARVPYSREWSYDPGEGRDSTLSIGPTSLSASAVVTADRSVWRTRSRYALPIGAVVSGVVGVWARQTADRSYDNYLATVDRGRIKSEYDRAARYDRIAVGCWVAAEALLVASVWTWLRGEPESWVRVDAEGSSTRVGLSLDGVLGTLAGGEGDQ